MLEHKQETRRSAPVRDEMVTAAFVRKRAFLPRLLGADTDAEKRREGGGDARLVLCHGKLGVGHVGV